MSLSHWRSARITVIVGLGLSLFAAACSTENPIFTGVDAQSPPGTATLTISKTGTATGAVSSAPGGIACGTSCSAIYPIGTMVMLTATPDAGAELAGWSGGGCSGTTPACTVTMDAAKSVTAIFNIAQYPVTINLGGSGTGMVVAPLAGIACPGSCTAMVQHGSQLSLTASTATGSLFMGWTVGADGTACAGASACTTTITGPTMITATFALYQSLEVVKSGNGNGTVTSSPAGINCGADCTEDYAQDAIVTLTPTPNVGSTFDGWSGGGCSGRGTCTVSMMAATSVTASFALKQYTLSIALVGSGYGSVTSSPVGIHCEGSCVASFTHGTTITLIASENPYSNFTGWSGGGCSGTEPSCIFTITADTAISASFTTANPCVNGLCPCLIGSTQCQ